MSKPRNRIDGRLEKLHKIELATLAVDDQDWDYLVSKLGYGGRDRFWRSVIENLRPALSKAAQELKRDLSDLEAPKR